MYRPMILISSIRVGKAESARLNTERLPDRLMSERAAMPAAVAVAFKLTVNRYV